MPVVEVYERTTTRFEAVEVLPLPDPFGVDNDCLNPSGHDFIASCRDIVCPHCSKVVWQ